VSGGVEGTNYSILQQNTLAGLSETAGLLYLKLLDVFEAHRSRENECRCLLAACRYDDQAGNVLDFIMRNSPAHNLDAGTLSKLSAFFADRWRHNFMEPSA
jgi:hypothetical protein